jgi:hypothetical protein
MPRQYLISRPINSSLLCGRRRRYHETTPPGQKKLRGRQGCQMVYFYTKNTSLCIFRRALEWKMLVYFMNIQIIHGHLAYFMAIWYSLWSFGIFFPVLVYLDRKNLATLVVGSLQSCLL